jgi:hypothetical protein
MRLETARSAGGWERLAVAAWVLVVLVVCGRGLALPHSHSLYPIFATAAHNWRAGEPLYDPAHQAAAHLDAFRYSPLVAALLTPLAAMPERLGNVLWRLLNAGVFLAGLAWWCRAVLPRSLSRDQRALLFLLVLPLCVGNLNNGQSNPLVLGFILAAVAAVAEERWNLAAACLAGACLFKLYPVAVGLLLVVVYPRQFTVRLLLALAAGLALPFLLQRPGYVAGEYACWFEYLRGDDRSAFPLELTYRDLQLLSRLSFGPMGPRLYLAVQLLAGAGMAVLCLVGRLASWPERKLLTLLVGLGCCWMTVFGPATESCTYVLLAPTLAWSLLAAWLGERPRWLRAWLVGSYGLLVASYVSCWFPSEYRLHTWGLQPLAGLLLLVCLLADAFREQWPSRRQGSCWTTPPGLPGR